MIYGVNIQTYFKPRLFIDLDKRASLRLWPFFDARQGPIFSGILSNYPASKYPIDHEAVPTIPAMLAWAGLSDNWTLNNWNQWFSYCLQRMPFVSTWEVGNEIIQYLFSGPTGYLATKGYEGYYDMLHDSYLAVKSSNPRAKVIAFGGIPCFGIASVRAYNNDDFTSTRAYTALESIWNYGAGDYCDAIAVHVYPHGNRGQGSFYADLSNYPVWNGVTCKYTVGECIQKQAQAFYALTHKPVYYDEIGILVGGADSRTGQPITLEQEATFLTEIFDLLGGLEGTAAIKWYELNGSNFGIFDPFTAVPRRAHPNFLSYLAIT
jgi:hypothetical protein